MRGKRARSPAALARGSKPSNCRPPEHAHPKIASRPAPVTAPVPLAPDRERESTNQERFPAGRIRMSRRRHAHFIRHAIRSVPPTA